MCTTAVASPRLRLLTTTMCALVLAMSRATTSVSGAPPTRSATSRSSWPLNSSSLSTAWSSTSRMRV